MSPILKWKLLIFLSTVYLHSSKSYRILGVFPFGSHSHFTFNDAMMDVLEGAGHELTVVSPYPRKSSGNLSKREDVDVSDVINPYNDKIDFRNDISADVPTTSWALLTNFTDMEKNWCDEIYNHEKFSDILKQRRGKYDVIFVELFNANCFLPLSVALDAPIIATIASRTWITADFVIGNPNNPSYVPRILGPVGHEMDFYQRCLNTYDYAISWAFQRFAAYEIGQIYADRYAPTWTMDRLSKKVALIFYNSHVVMHRRNLAPNAIEVGGIHLKIPKKLPKDLLEFVEGAENGVVFFSFGSMLNIKSIPKEIVVEILAAFAEIPQRVLWRYANVHNLQIPENVRLSEWFPQRDILAHKNVVAFIGHGGSLSIFEAIDTATPMICIPIRFDQRSNVALLKELGNAIIHIPIESLTKETLIQAIRTIVYDESYGIKMEKLSELLHDRPLTAQQTVLFWTEYVARHKGAKYLRVKAADMPFYQYLMLDVAAAFAIAFSAFSYAVFKIGRKLLSNALERGREAAEISEVKYKKCRGNNEDKDKSSDAVVVDKDNVNDKKKITGRFQ